MENRIKLRVLGLTYSQIQNGAYALVLAEEEGPRRIPIVIGTSEAQSIAIQLERLVPPRPLTHDLFVSFSHSFGIRLIEILIYKFEDGVFYSEMVFQNQEGIEIKIDSRTSDAIAVALRSKANIYTLPHIIEETGIVFAEEPVEKESDSLKRAKKKDLKELSLEELQDKLDKAIKKEAFELAATIQQEINNRKGNNTHS